MIKNQIQGPQDISKVRTINMSAEGKVTASPDTASVQFSVVTTGATADQVQKDNDKKMATVITYIKSLSIDAKDIQTTNYNLYPQYDYNQPKGNEPTITGYSLNQMVSVKVRKLDTVPKLIGGLTGVGVNQINQLSYYIDDPDSLRAQAREQAVSKAKTKAQDLANQLGVKLGKVVNFSEGQSGYPVPMPYATGLAMGKGGGGGPAPVEPGSQDVTVDVNLTFELK